MPFKKSHSTDTFFDLFEQLANEALRAATTFCDSALSANEKRARIKETEERADGFVHTVVTMLDAHNRPPLKGRAEIFRLVHNIDNVIDCIEEAAFWMSLAELQFSQEFLNLGNLIKEAAQEMQEALPHLRTIRKKQESVDRITTAAIRLNELEEMGDGIYRAMLEKIEKEKRAAQTIGAWHTLDRTETALEMLEKALDQCEDVGNFLESMKQENV